MINTGITIDGIKPFTEDGAERTTVHTYNDLGLILATYYIPEPKVKEKRIQIPFASGSVDLTEVFGYIPYEDRSGIYFDFILKNKDYEEYNKKIQKLNNMLHGRKLKLILDTDPTYYYSVRLHLDETKTNTQFSKIRISGVADPYKYSVEAYNEDWLWSPFDFEDGEVHNKITHTVTNTETVVIPSGKRPVVPIVTVTTLNTTLTVQKGVNGRIIRLKLGDNELPQIMVNGDEETSLVFKGNATFEVNFRGASL